MVIGGPSDGIGRERILYDFFLVERRSFWSRHKYALPGKRAQLLREAFSVARANRSSAPSEAWNLDRAAQALCAIHAERSTVTKLWEDLIGANPDCFLVEATVPNGREWAQYERQVRALRVTDDLSAATAPSVQLRKERDLEKLFGSRRLVKRRAGEGLAELEKLYQSARRDVDLVAVRPDLFRVVEAEAVSLMDRHRALTSRLRRAESLCEQALASCEAGARGALARSLTPNVIEAGKSAARLRALRPSPDEVQLEELERSLNEDAHARRAGRAAWEELE